MQPSHESSDRTQRPLLAQSAYYVVTGVFPFVSRRGFEALTGPKREWWLVQTVGAVVLAADGRLINVFAIDIVDGAVQTVRSVINPDKLRHLGPVADVWALLRDGSS